MSAPSEGLSDIHLAFLWILPAVSLFEPISKVPSWLNCCCLLWRKIPQLSESLFLGSASRGRCSYLAQTLPSSEVGPRQALNLCNLFLNKNYYFFKFNFYLLASTRSIQNLSSPARDWTHVPFSGSTNSSPPCHQGSPINLVNLDILRKKLFLNT